MAKSMSAIGPFKNPPVFWFGAGLSMASAMPSGYQLTRAWMEHHLPAGETEAILALFERNSELLRKSFPRLEKVIEDSLWSFGTGCLENLRFFDECRPNAQHAAIAHHLITHRCFAFTTNFDTAVEQVRPGAIPTMTPITGLTHDWGLIKLHGSMGDDLAGLGHSISNLRSGLFAPFRDLIIRLLDDPETMIVFCGYSGADFFDVTPLFQDRLRQQKPFAAQVLWLHHTGGADDGACGWGDEEWEEVLSEGAQTILAAFEPERRHRRAGTTWNMLAELVPFPVIDPPTTARPWSQGWEERFSPDMAGRRLFAARLHASFGIGHRSASFIDPDGLPRDRVDQRHQLWCNALRDQGFYDAELRLRRALRPLPGAASREFEDRQWAAALRLAGHVPSAGLLYLRLLWRYALSRRAWDRAQVLWTVAEAGLFAQAILAALPRQRLLRLALLWAELPLRLMVGASLVVFGRLSKDCEHAADPHLQMTVTRISNYLASYPGWLIAALEELIYWRDGLPVLEFHDDTPDRYRETDSLLGLVNHLRHDAALALADVQWGWFGLAGDWRNADTNSRIWLNEAADSLRLSFRMAGIINDHIGMIKAASGLARLARWRQRPRSAALWQRIAGNIQQCHRQQASAAVREVEVWLARGAGSGV